MVNLLVKRLTTTARLPLKGSAEAAGFDLHVDSFDRDYAGWVVKTGLAIALPLGQAMLIYPRSGLGTKLGLTLRNGTGVIDSDYRGEIILKLDPGYLSTHWDEIVQALQPGSRIAQAMIVPVPDVLLTEVYELPDSVRGTGGFGSTGN